MSRVLALDLGSRRLGLALSDAGGTVATPLVTIAHSDRRRDLAEIAKVAATHRVDRIVVGWPRNMDGTSGSVAKRAEAFAAALRRMVQIPVDMWDERLTTAAAERALLAFNVRRSQRRAVRDQVAAALILQSYLDARRIREAGAVSEPQPAKGGG